jgi:uncharacterized protein (UPF0332 family)
MDAASERIEDARLLLGAERFTAAVSAAYYAMLYAARAALSEVDENAKTHSGTWGRFHARFVASGRFDAALHATATSAQEVREGADYRAVRPDRAEAEALVEDASRYVTAVEAMIRQQRSTP